MSYIISYYQTFPTNKALLRHALMSLQKTSPDVVFVLHPPRTTLNIVFVFLSAKPADSFSLSLSLLSYFPTSSHFFLSAGVSSGRDAANAGAPHEPAEPIGAGENDQRGQPRSKGGANRRNHSAEERARQEGHGHARTSTQSGRCGFRAPSVGAQTLLCHVALFHNGLTPRTHKHEQIAQRSFLVRSITHMLYHSGHNRLCCGNQIQSA